MKTVKASGITHHLQEGTSNYFNDLAKVIRDHRAYLIDCKINLLEMYVEYRFSKRLNSDQLNNAKRSLNGLMHSPINISNYQHIIDSLNRYSFIDLPNTLFYKEIDERLIEVLKQAEINFSTKPQFENKRL